MYRNLPNTDLLINVADGSYVNPAVDEKYQSWIAEGGIPQPADMPNPNDVITAQIAAIESATMVPRVMREYLLVSMADIAQRHAAATGQSAANILEANVGYVKTKAVDDQIRALRSQLT